MADKVWINEATIEQARQTMYPLMEAQATGTAIPGDEDASNPLQANMLAHAALLLHACKELGIDVTEALKFSNFALGVMKTTQETLH